MRYLYSAAFYLLLPLVLLRMLWRSRSVPGYRRRLGERLGFFPSLVEGGKPVLWVHAVSVGETLAAIPLLEALLEDYPDYRLLVTTTTPTGSERVRTLLGDRVLHVYAPWDLPGAVARFFRRTQPVLLLLMETELWPNIMHTAAGRGVPVLLANARMSARSAAGYRRFPSLGQPMFTALSLVACQAEADARRFADLGVAGEKIQVTGSIKFDQAPDGPLMEQASALAEQWQTGGRPVLVAASTHPGEEEIILAAFGSLRRRFSNCLLVLVPRHPERSPGLLKMASAAGLRTCLRSADQPPSAAHDVVIGDTMGELRLLMSLGDIALVGGSLIPHGGHNILEAAAWGVPVVTGPHMFNFAHITELMVEAGAMVRLEAVEAETLSETLMDLLTDDGRRQQMGQAGKSVVAANRGAKAKLLALVADALRASATS